MNIDSLVCAKFAFSIAGGLVLTACPMSEEEPEGDGSPTESWELSIMTEDGRADANLSCLGEGTQPNSNSTREWSIPAYAFAQVDEEGNPLLVPGLEIQIFPDNAIPSGSECERCRIASDEGDGFYSFEGPSEGWIAYRVLERSTAAMGPPVLRTSEANFELQSDAFNIMYAPVLDGLHQQLGLERDTTRALVAGRLVDCDGVPIEGATVRVLDSEGRPFEDRGVLTFYLDDQGPAPELSQTSFAGRWSLVNVPAAEEVAYIEMRAPSGALISCEKIAISENGFTALRARPLRSDSPDACER